MRKTYQAVLAAALIIPCAAASAAEKFPASYSSIGLEGSYVDSGNSEDKEIVKDNLSNYNELGINLTRQFNPYFTLFLQGGWANSETRNTELDIDVMQGSLGGRLTPAKFRLGNWRPFGGLGYSYTDFDVEDAESKSEDAVYVEGGLQRMMGSQFMLEGGVRARTELEDSYVDGQYFAGVHYLFDQEYPKIQKPKVIVKTVQPVVEPPKDSDGDGVIDELDKCPNTPQGALVDSDGCPKELTKDIKKTLYVEFEFDKTEVRREFYPAIADLANIMRQYPTSRILLEGHTDSMGTNTYNQKLSQSRADAVMKVLINEFGIAAERITTTGMGETQPIATNATEEGRAKNRRVEAIVSGKYSEILKK